MKLSKKSGYENLQNSITSIRSSEAKKKDTDFPFVMSKMSIWEEVRDLLYYTNNIGQIEKISGLFAEWARGSAWNTDNLISSIVDISYGINNQASEIFLDKFKPMDAKFDENIESLEKYIQLHMLFFNQEYKEIEYLENIESILISKEYKDAVASVSSSEQLKRLKSLFLDRIKDNSRKSNWSRADIWNIISRDILIRLSDIGHSN